MGNGQLITRVSSESILKGGTLSGKVSIFTILAGTATYVIKKLASKQALFDKEINYLP